MKEINRLHFAATVMSVLAALFLAGMAFYFFDGRTGAANTGAGKDIFDSCKTILPPIATLVLGYYFGQPDRLRDDVESRDRARS
jgi:hypothetical protein